MMNKLQVTGRQNFMGKDIPVVLGGFGADKKCISDKTIAEIHGMEIKHVRELLNRNSLRFRDGEDCIDLKKVVVQNDYNFLVLLGYSQMQISKSEHIYILSERGYAKLIKIMDTDLAWVIHDKLIDEYFELRERTARQEFNPASDKRSKAMLLNSKNKAAQFLKGLYDNAGVAPEYQVLAFQSFYGEDAPALPAAALKDTIITYDKGTIAKKLGLLSKNGTPHAQAIGAIIGKLEISENERISVPYFRHGHDGFDYQYTDSVVDKVSRWLNENNYPTIIRGNKDYSVVYAKQEVA